MKANFSSILRSREVENHRAKNTYISPTFAWQAVVVVEGDFDWDGVSLWSPADGRCSLVPVILFLFSPACVGAAISVTVL